MEKMGGYWRSEQLFFMAIYGNSLWNRWGFLYSSVKGSVCPWWSYSEDYRVIYGGRGYEKREEVWNEGKQPVVLCCKTDGVL